VIIFPSSGTGAWEACIVNTLSPDDKVLMVETGHFATLWRQMAVRWGIEVDFLPGDWRHGASPAENETSTGVTSRISEIRAAMDQWAMRRVSTAHRYGVGSVPGLRHSG
jgi:alanine-glyoxylate transaminase/serine-glyoxylate transaminase/serine-pyruvate transaminase